MIDNALTIKQMIVLKMLNGLGSSFFTYLTIINEHARRDKKLPDKSSLLKNLADEESRMKTTTGATANFVKKKGKGKIIEIKLDNKDKCHRCGNKHSDTCKFIKTKCTGCGKIGHIERACNSKRGKEKDDDSDVERKKIFCVLTIHSPSSIDFFVFSDTAEEDGSNIKHPETNINKTFQIRKFLCIINRFILISKSVDLLIDSGATDHALGNKDLFEPGSYRIMSNKLETGSGEVLKTEERGSLSLFLKNETEGIREFVLTDVLYTSDLNFNLISTARLAQKRVEIFLRKAGELSKIYYEEKVIDHAKLIDNQYFIQTTFNSRALATIKNIFIHT